ncbi:MAG: acylphosphatase [Pseudomonadota bacterium]
MADDRQCLHLSVVGRVQGVGFRAWLQHTAVGLGLDGWVRNRRDGSVEALVAGPRRAVAELLAACHRGPALARVDHVTTGEHAAPAEAGFRTLPTV